MAVMAKASVQTTVRLDPELYERAKAAAGSRALNTWIVEAIAEKLKRAGVLGVEPAALYGEEG